MATVVLRNRGEQLIFEAYIAEGFKQQVSAEAARKIADQLNRLGARVFHWQEIVMTLIFVAVVALVLGFVGGMLIGGAR